MPRHPLRFDWRLDIGDEAKAQVRRHIENVLARYRGLIPEPALVVVTRPGINPADTTILADIRARPDLRIGTATIADNGAGRLCFTLDP